MSWFPNQRGSIALALSLLLGLSACASSGASTRSTTPAVATAGFPVTVASAQGPITVAARPQAIVSLSPTATETLFAIGAGGQVVAVDDQSNYPPNAPKSQLSGFKPNVEAIAAKRPDLVVIDDDIAGLVAALAKVNIPVLVQPAAKRLDDVYSQVQALGRATGHAAPAEALAGSMRSQIGSLIRSVVPRAAPPRIYDELDQTLYSVTSSTFLGQLFKTMGADNIADAADKTGSGYPQLSDEYVVKANPELIFLSDTKCCHQNKVSVASRPGWAGIAAIKQGNVIAIDDDIASRWGPRIVDLVGIIAHALSGAGGAG